MKNALEAHFPGCFIPVLPDKHFRVFTLLLFTRKIKKSILQVGREFSITFAKKLHLENIYTDPQYFNIF